MQREIVVDSFAGGGGASLGISWALGRGPDIAINHDKEAIALHAANHPDSVHLAEDVWHVDPVEACAGRPVGLMWLSPDCKHFSKAKGGKPVSKKIRGLAWVAVRWAKAVRPRVIVLENVEEFKTWGPVLVSTNKPCPDRKGQTFRAFKRKLERLGYNVEHRELRACDYGAPTIRKRLFLVARCDGRPIVWPTPTHGKHLPHAWRTAAECIEWSIPCPSIFERKKPLADNTLKRIARGIKRFVIDSPRPFIVNLTHHGADRVESIDEPMRTITGANRGEKALCAPTLIHIGNGEREGQAPRALDLQRPLNTIVSTGKFGLVAAFLAKHYTTDSDSASLFAPVPTVTAVDHNALVTAHLAGATRYAEVRAFMVAYFGNEKDGADLFHPMRTVTSRDRFGLVTVEGFDCLIADIGMRMLAPRELYRAQGFPDSYRIDVEFNGKPLTKTAQVRMVGNSVCPPVAAAIVRSNYGAQAGERAA